MLRSNRGFTLVELMIVVLLMGLMLGFAVPALRSLGNSHSLKGAKEDVMAELQLARSKAMSTGVAQPVHFYPGTYGWDYHTHPASGGMSGFRFPRGVSYGWASAQSVNITMKTDGTADFPSGQNFIPLKNDQGLRDTIVVFASGQAFSQ